MDFVTPKEIARILKDEHGIETDRDGKKVRSFMRKMAAEKSTSENPIETPGKGGSWRIPTNRVDRFVADFKARKSDSGAVVDFDIWGDDDDDSAADLDSAE